MSSPHFRARENATHFEAKKTGFGQAQDGWSITLRVQHDDLPTHIKDARKGTRYMVALVEIGDDEQPIARLNEVPAPSIVSASSSGEREPASDPGLPAERERKRRDWSAMRYSAQAVLRCRDPIFRAFLREYCGVTDNSPEGAAEFVRKHCNVNSRADIKSDTEAERHWHEIERWFAAWQTKERAMA